MKPWISLITALLVCMIPLSRPLAEELVINAVGDVMLAGRWTPLFKARGYDFPFAAVRGELAGGDVNLANLESPVAQGGSEHTAKRFRFRAAPAMAAAVSAAGFNLVTLANNHSMDFGTEALLETLVNLEAAGVAWIGAGRNLEEARRPVIRLIKGTRIAFLAYSLTQPVEFFAGRDRPGTAPAYGAYYAGDIAAARSQADYVIVSFHWGVEGSRIATAGQQSTARRAIDAGADVVIGHHPHVLQGIERYRNGIIFYSLGNFAFASAGRTGDSLLVRLRLDEGRRRAELVPLDVLHRRVGFQPRPLSGPRADRVVRELNRLSQPFGTSIVAGDGRYWIDF